MNTYPSPEPSASPSPFTPAPADRDVAAKLAARREILTSIEASLGVLEEQEQRREEMRAALRDLLGSAERSLYAIGAWLVSRRRPTYFNAVGAAMREYLQAEERTEQ